MKKVLPLILLILALAFTSCTMKKSEKLYPVLKYTDKDASYVFINKDNEVKIDKHFEDVLKAFEDDYAVVIENGKVAIINREGEDALSGIENVYQIKDGLVTVKNKDKTELVDLETKEVLLKYDYILIGENKVLSYLEGDKWGYRTLDGEKTLAAQFEEAYPFGKNSGVAVKDGKVVIVDGEMNVKETNYTESYK
ncbi:MAG: WG repeat-containing protein, partial [Ezakiella sp.]